MFSPCCCFSTDVKEPVERPKKRSRPSTDNENENSSSEELHDPSVPGKKKRKAYIPATLRAAVWNTYIGDTIGKTKCPVCNTNDITPFTFQCGHVVAEACGGRTNLENLRPICAQCNVSSQKRHMEDFRKEYFSSV
jgi:5-methylcytosine-specific restriction endonuclease McrA